MGEEQSVQHWIEGLKAGDQAAAHMLWDRYFQRLVRLVHSKLPTHLRRAFDEEDVALSAFKSFCAGVERDHFPNLGDSDNLWQIMAVIASRKAQAYLRSHNRQKRGGGRVRGESALTAAADSSAQGLGAILDSEPSPAFAAQFTEECERLLDALDDEQLQSIALLKMQGFLIDEIASRVGCTRRAVQRRLEIIRRTWRNLISAAEEAE